MQLITIGRWDRPDVPHLGWRLVDVFDFEEAEHVCEMCGNEQVRYVHEVAHPRHRNLLVGCVCAEKMTGDYKTPRRRESRLKRRHGRRERWMARAWRTSNSGNEYRLHKGRRIGVFPGRFGPGWVYYIGPIYSNQSYANPDEAKRALFEDLFHRRLI